MSKRHDRLYRRHKYFTRVCLLIERCNANRSNSDASVVADLRLAGAFVGGDSFAPGDANTLRAIIHRVTGSGSRSNVYADVLDPPGPVPSASQETGNRLEITGSRHAFLHTNAAINPAPEPEFFHNQH